MFNRKSSYALNKKDPNAIVYMDANEAIIRLTREDFASEEEFLKWKSLSDADYEHYLMGEIDLNTYKAEKAACNELLLKTKNAYRTLPLSADAISVLKIQKCKVGNSEWVFPSPTGGPMSPDSVLHMLQRVLKRAGLPRIRFHDLRHTCATMLCRRKISLRDIQLWLGHSTYQTTADIYTHLDYRDKMNTANAAADMVLNIMHKNT